MTDAPSHIDLEFPPSFLEFTRQCEVYCVAGCCGLDAFSFDDQTLGAAIDRLGIEEAEAACTAGLDFADTHRGEKLECWSEQDDFNHCWTNGKDFYDWTKTVVSSVKEQIKQRTEQDGGEQPATRPESK